eukprot:TRINITY_DN23554_c0_g1_i1.p1 TRINITY_DN23554_c0_g1~~TRINITY_DN23554_c0_g1_i1.p1  ORF type:complete len:314 (-),score=53.71 TRINITY_DN23554_c0_g1_i1:109-1050(-)
MCSVAARRLQVAAIRCYARVPTVATSLTVRSSFRARPGGEGIFLPSSGPCRYHASASSSSSSSSSQQRSSQEKRVFCASAGAAVPLLVALDLDECLVHSTDFSYGDAAAAGAHQFQGSSAAEATVDGVEKFKLSMVGGASCTVLKRKGLDEFIRACASRFETYVFTAGTQMYADSMLDIIDPDRLLAGRLYRTDCSLIRGPKGDQYAKDLSAVIRKGGRSEGDFARVVLVDNNPISFVCQPSNGIPVPHFLGQSDDILPRVLELLQYLHADGGDVRPALDKLFKLEALLADERAALLKHREAADQRSRIQSKL